VAIKAPAPSRKGSIGQGRPDWSARMMMNRISGPWAAISASASLMRAF
jgi:hypothetical protein